MYCCNNDLFFSFLWCFFFVGMWFGYILMVVVHERPKELPKFYYSVQLMLSVRVLKITWSFLIVLVNVYIVEHEFFEKKKLIWAWCEYAVFFKLKLKLYFFFKKLVNSIFSENFKHNFLVFSTSTSVCSYNKYFQE